MNNGYFDITIRNKYDSVTTKRKETKKVIASLITAAIICCSSLMIFSFDVSSTSETQNSEDIKGKSETYFPTPTRSEVKTSTTTTAEPIGTTEAVKTEKVVMMGNISSNTTDNTTSNQIVSETDNNSSENQNNTVVTGQSISVITGTAIMETPVVITASPVETFQTVTALREVLLTPSASPLVTQPPTYSDDLVTLYESEINTINSDADFDEYQRDLEEKEEIRQEKIRKKRLKEKKRLASMNWKKGGNAGKSGLFKDTSTRNKMARSIWKFLKSAGYEDGAVAGVLGNIEQESSFQTNATACKYKGLYQLDIGDRFGNCINWCNKNGYNPYGAEGQTRFALEEMVDEGSRRDQFENFTGYSKEDYPNIKDPEIASHVWTAGYEGCIAPGYSYYAGRSAQWQDDAKRQAYARKWYEKFKGTT